MGEIVALLLTDVVDSTLTTQRLGDNRALALWTEHDRCARDLLRLHHGREIDRADGFLLMFDTAANAAWYALDYHAALADSASRHVLVCMLGRSSCGRRQPPTSRLARSGSKLKASQSRSPPE